MNYVLIYPIVCLLLLIYNCQNFILVILVLTKNMMCLVPPDSTMGPPQFTKGLKDLTVNDGDSLTLTAHVQGDPEPQVVWTKDGKPLSSSEVIDLKYKNGIAKLHINEVYPEDEGSYVCKATNSMGTAETTCKLSIKCKYLSI